MSYGWRSATPNLQIEFCDECGFDGRYVHPGRALHTLLADIERLLRDPNVEVQPAPDTWSARAYAAHCLDMCGETLSVILHSRPEPRVPLATLADAQAELDALMVSLEGSDLDRRIDLGGPFPATPRWMLVHLQHDLEHHRLDIRRGYARLALTSSAGPTVHR